MTCRSERASSIADSVMVDEAIPIGEFADITIGDWRGYDVSVV